MNKDSGRIGSSFDAFLEEEGMLDECEERAIKELLAMQVDQAIKAEGISETQMDSRMNTSRQDLEIVEGE